MARVWEVIGEGADRMHKLTITTPGRAPQVFKGKTKADIAEQLANAQEEATVAIDTLKQTGRTPPPKRDRRRPLSDGERMQVATDMTNPAKVDAAVTRVLEATVGPVAEVRAAVDDGRERSAAELAVAAATEFFQGTPDWYPSEHNKKTLVRYMQAQSMDNTKAASYTEAFEELKAAGLLQSAPTNPQSEPAGTEPIAPPKPAPPARMSTGVRSSDVSGDRLPSSGFRPKYTREQLDKMSAKQYGELLKTDRKALEASEEFWNRQQRRSA